MRFLALIVLINFYTAVYAGWLPPENPSPRKILDEAREDARAGRYEDALLKHLWFHNNALKYDRAFYGVRLSFALSDWQELGHKYPEAMHSLEATRDMAGANVRSSVNYYDSFNDYKSINEKLGEEEKTIQLFRWLDKNRQDRAKKVYRLAQSSLVRAKEYELCSKYIDPENSYLRYVRYFRSGLEFSKQSPFQAKAESFAYTSFSNDVATLVALLARGGRKAEAEEVAEMAMLEWDDANFSSALSEAIEGKVPTPWP
ncbi:hypothetical protein [Sedimenticola thiotaurini]|uniref:Uncharacterized protein n=1 Tax=Sedimenticola thiotaurini TaxID=1543721 RepID=A0A0F7JWK3_9GAMM|nr:hypothetical protein [Sedimenticola thiotaurini]AKH20886.1 hypothetical protein AAY24_11585 [Sedimenticola thiotaurini]